MKMAVSQEVQREAHKIVGKHVYGNLYEVRVENLTEAERLKEIVVGAAEEGNLHIIEMIVKKFNSYNEFPGGVSVIALIEESHIALHTWPESRYATLDIYSCGEKADPDKAFRYIIAKLAPKKYKTFKADRSTK
ncbi:MAG: adenosylmethionine decarboxylase [Candidatus Micrarchaeaceae archaeon]